MGVSVSGHGRLWRFLHPASRPAKKDLIARGRDEAGAQSPAVAPSHQIGLPPPSATWTPSVPRIPSSLVADKSASTSDNAWFDDEWVNIRGVGMHQQALTGPVPRPVQVELYPWAQTPHVAARVNGKTIGNLSDGFAGHVYEVLRARRDAGLPPVTVPGEVRQGDFVPVYLAVKIPHWGKLDAWIDSVAPPGWMPAQPNRPSQEEVRLHATARYQEALAGLFEKYGARSRSVNASIEWTTTRSGKSAGEPMGLVSLDAVVFAELQATHPEHWHSVYADYQAGTPGRLLVRLTRDGDKFGATGVYKTPRPA